MNAQKLNLDYFKLYDVANQNAGYVVGLQGQFDKYMEKAQLTYLNLFGNPASKNGEPMCDKNAHLNWYDIYDPTPDPTRVVVYENQFGQSKLYTGRAYSLLVPAQKYFKGSVFPEKLDHYKVYQVLQGEPANAKVTLEDQFGKSETKVYDPIFFAVPVKKYYEGQTYGIYNEKAHLVIYRIYPETSQQTIMVRDQFSRRYEQTFRSIVLAAPSVKLKWEEI